MIQIYDMTLKLCYIVLVHDIVMKGCTISKLAFNSTFPDSNSKLLINIDTKPLEVLKLTFHLQKNDCNIMTL